MSLYWESTVFGDVRVEAIHGRSGIGLSELSFTLVWSLHSTRTSVFSVFGTSIWVSVSAEGDTSPRLLGQAMPEAAWCDETRDFSQEGRRCLYRLPMPSPQLLDLEGYRHGRNLVFSLDVRGNSYCEKGIRSFNETLTLHVNPSDWARVLREANAAEVLLVGVHLPSDVSSEKYRASLELVRRANNHLIQGDFTIAVAECRRALDSLWKAANLGQRAVNARKVFAEGADRTKMRKKDRELAYGEALRHLCHGAHHVDADSAPVEYGRLDAVLIVSSTVALISALVASPDTQEPEVAKDVSPPVDLSSASRAPTPIPAPAKPAEDSRKTRLDKAVAHIKKVPANRPTTVEKLRKSLGTYFRAKLDESQLDQLLKDLEKRGTIKVDGTKVTYIVD